MANIKLHNDINISATYVSNAFIDHYMTSANGEYVKIYLYLLRCMNSEDSKFSLSDVADRFEHTEKDIHRALKYWEKMNLIRLEYDSEDKISNIYFLNQNTATATAKTSNTEPPPQTQTATVTNTEIPSHNYSTEELAAFREKEAITELLFVTENYLRRPLNPTDLNTILSWYDQLHFPPDLIEYLIEYCLGKGHTSFRYMDRVAIAWKKENIDTVEQAKQVSTAFTQTHFSVMKALGITGRNLVSSEVAYIEKWSKQYGFSIDIIQEACRRTISATHQPSFEYTDSILSKWHQQNVHHLQDIIRLDTEYQREKIAETQPNKAISPNRFNNFPQRTYNYELLEQQLLEQQLLKKEL